VDVAAETGAFPVQIQKAVPEPPQGGFASYNGVFFRVAQGVEFPAGHMIESAPPGQAPIAPALDRIKTRGTRFFPPMHALAGRGQFAGTDHTQMAGGVEIVAGCVQFQKREYFFHSFRCGQKQVFVSHDFEAIRPRRPLLRKIQYSARRPRIAVERLFEIPAETAHARFDDGTAVSHDQQQFLAREEAKEVLQL